MMLMLDGMLMQGFGETKCMLNTQGVTSAAQKKDIDAMEFSRSLAEVLGVRSPQSTVREKNGA